MQAYNKKTQFFFSFCKISKIPCEISNFLTCFDSHYVWMRKSEGSKIATLIHSWEWSEFLKMADFPIFEVLEEFGEGLTPIGQCTYYSCNKITETWIQISRQNWFGFSSNISHQMIIYLTHEVSRSKSKWYGHQRYTYRVLQTIQLKLILLWVWAERAVLGRAKTALKFKYEI